MKVFSAAGKPVLIKTPAEEFPREKPEQVPERDNSFNIRRIKL